MTDYDEAKKAMKELIKISKEAYDEAITQGYTEKQALELSKTFVLAIMGKVPSEEQEGKQ